MSKKKPAGNPRHPNVVSQKRLWAFRLTALLGVPLLFFGCLEAGLRLAGYGYPTHFLLPSENHGVPTFIQNNQFGWRFFGRRMARTPHPISISRTKAPASVRVFVFGESAAFGDPQPRLGLARVLQAMLELRHPRTKFEVINAAMTGINSHAILPIVKDCAKADGDIWVVYMGNNEVVGPFGAGTVFGPQVPPLPLIRANLVLKATRTGQWLDSVLQALKAPPSAKSEWGGMTMFLNHRVPADDARMARVYHHFEANLSGIIDAGRRAGVGMVISTVGVNLMNCAPFASLHRPDLNPAQLSDWDQSFSRGTNAQQSGNIARAQSFYRTALAIDDQFAELRFRLARCALASGDVSAAAGQFGAARDLDTLRFRSDSTLRLITQRVTEGRANPRLRWVDGAGAFESASTNGLPGANFFYEHVHLKFEGNWVLARTIAEKVEELLPAGSGGATQPWPDTQACAQRLGFTDRALQAALSEIVGRLSDPPFTLQMDHAEQLERLARVARGLPPTDSGERLQAARQTFESAISRTADDSDLYEQLGEIKQAQGDHAGAVAAAQRAVDLVPSDSESLRLLGLALAQEQKYEAAMAAFRQAIKLYGEDVWARQNFAICLQKLGRPQESIHEFQTALAVKPRFGLAWLGLGQVYETIGRTNDAEMCYQKALANPVHRADELTTLARFCQTRKWFEAAATNFAEAIVLNPSDAALRIEAGQVLSLLDRHADAARNFAEAYRLAPALGQAHFLCGVELGRIGQPAQAEIEFLEAVRLMPGVVEAQLNLGIAQYQQKKFPEAIASFNGVLARDPQNATALRLAQAIGQANGPAGKQ